MKIEIDLNDIMGDESGVETLADSVRRQVIEKLSREVKEGIGRKIDSELSQVIGSTIRQAMESLMPSTIENLMEAEYKPVDRYGDRCKENTTFRKELVKTIHEQMVYKKTNYDSDKNAFTKAVDAVIAENVKHFQTEFNTLVNSQFTHSCFVYAQTELQKKLGIK